MNHPEIAVSGMKKHVDVIVTQRPVKLHRVWTFRHFRVCLAGSICAGVYAGGLRWAEGHLGIEVPPWAIAIIGQAALWLGFVCARYAWFD